MKDAVDILNDQLTVANERIYKLRETLNAAQDYILTIEKALDRERAKNAYLEDLVVHLKEKQEALDQAYEDTQWL